MNFIMDLDTMTSKSEMALLNCVSGHPLALQRLREMQAVVTAARIWAEQRSELLESTIGPEHDLRVALRAGGWIKPGE